jgi:hypothetical protein
MVQAFRRGTSSCAAMGLPLKGLDPKATYGREEHGSAQGCTHER